MIGLLISGYCLVNTGDSWPPPTSPSPVLLNMIIIVVFCLIFLSDFCVLTSKLISSSIYRYTDISPSLFFFFGCLFLQLNNSKVSIKFAWQLEEITAIVYILCCRVLLTHPVTAAADAHAAWRLYTNTNLCERDPISSTAHHSWGQCHFLLNPSLWWISFQNWRQKSSVLDNEATENKSHRENDLLIVNRLQFKRH